MNTLQTRLEGLHNTIRELESIIEEKTSSIQSIDSQLLVLQENRRAETLQLEEFTKKLQGHRELMQETDNYYHQIQQNIETLMTILTTSRDA